MGDRQPIRDRTLILRILVPGLETRLRDKTKEMEEAQAAKGPADPSATKETILDLEGVTCEPTSEGSTLWNFHCDGATYPARLVNLPCPIELHKTHDHAMYYKCSDIAQMLIVYEDSMALDEADAYPKTEGYPSYYHSGLTSTLKRVVERRFALREQTAVPPPRAEVSDVENELHELMCKISKEGGKRNKVPSLASAQHANKVLEEIVEDVVDYEPWMDDYGAQPSGIEIEGGDQLASLHPEIWIPTEKIAELKAKEREKEEEALKKKQAATAKKEKKKKKKEAAAAEPPPPSKKKGIASKKHEAPVDEVTQAALEMTAGDLMDAVLDEDDPLDFGFDLDNMDDIADMPGL
jgi:transcription initiation factor TFIID subunit 7